MTPSSTGRLGAWILAWLLALPAATTAAELTPAGSFAADALIVREKKIPILVFYTRNDCNWCEFVRNRYLIPLARNPAAARRVLIREVGLDADFDTPLTDFGGRTTTHSAFARTRRIRLTPTLDFLDDRGNRLVDPIVGVRLPDFYGTFIDRAIDESIARLKADK